MADVNVTFGAEDTLSPTISKIKGEMRDLEATGAQTGQKMSGLLTPLPKGLGGPSTTPLLDAATAAAKRNAGALREVTGATDELSEATKRGGINFEAMFERMAVRLVVFEAIRLAIQGVKLAMDEFSKLEQAKIQFDALSLSADNLGAKFEALRRAAAEGLMPIDKAVALRNALIDLGATEDQTVWLTRELGQWSHVLGIDADRLAEALGRVAKGEGSLQDMRLVTRMMGDQREAGLQLIQTYEKLEKAQKALELENKTVAQSMDAVVRATEQMSERMERSRTRGGEFLKQAGITPGIEAQLPRLAALPPNLSVDYLRATGMLQLPQMPLGTSRIVLNQIQDMIAQYRAGLRAIQQQEGLSPQAMRELGPTLPIDYVMRAAKEAREDQLRDLREGASADREHRGFMQDQAAVQTQAAKMQLQTLPQAVTGPPAEIWNQWKGSLDGLAAQAKENTNEMVKAMWDSTKPLAAAMDRAAASNERVYDLLTATGT